MKALISTTLLIPQCILASILFSACGADQTQAEKDKLAAAQVQQQTTQQGSTTSTATPNTSSSSAVVQTTAAPKEVVIEYRDEYGVKMKVYAVTTDLPQCKIAIDAVTVYVKAEDKFFECTENRWLQVIPKDPKVIDDLKADMPNSTVPILTPLPPIPASAPVAEQPLSANQWRDPMTAKIWTVGGLVPFQLAQTACGDKAIFPARELLLEATSHGLGSTFKLDTAWVDEYDLSASSTSAFVIKFGPKVSIVTGLMTESHTVLCVNK